MNQFSYSFNRQAEEILMRSPDNIRESIDKVRANHHNPLKKKGIPEHHPLLLD